MSTCNWCGVPTSLECGNRFCGAAYCSREHQQADWTQGGHGPVCKEVTAWAHALAPHHAAAAAAIPVTPQQIDGIIDRLLGRDNDDDDDDDDEKDGFFARLRGRFVTDDDKSDAVIEKLKTDGGALGELRQLKANALQTRQSKNAEDLYKNTNRGAVTSVLKEMRELTGAIKDKDAAKVTRLAAVTKSTSTTQIVKRMFAKLALAGFKVSLAGGKVGAGIGTSVANAIGVPLETVVDVISIALDVAIFASTTLEAIYGIIRGFLDAKDAMVSLLRFEGGPPGVAASVDSVFDYLNSVGLKGRAQQFIGSLIQLFERFIRWGAPVIGSIVGTAIPFDAAVVGRVVEFFLYPIKFFITKGWLLITRLWSLLPQQWQEIVSSREQWLKFCVSALETIKRIFPVGKDDTDWKHTVIEKAQKIGVNVLRFHPLVIVGVVSKERLSRTADRLGSAATSATDFVDVQVNKFIDNVVAPNIDKIITITQAALGVGFGLIYTLHAYTPDGTRKRLGIAVPDVTPSAAALVGAHLATDRLARERFLADRERRQHEVRAVMCRHPTHEGLAFLSVCAQIGVPIDRHADYMGVPAAAERNFVTHCQLFWLDY